MKLGRKAQACALLALICAQAAFANPIPQGLLKGLEFKGGASKGQTAGAVLGGKANLSCPAGYTLEQDKLGLPHCAKRTALDCPKGTFLNEASGTCCPPENLCFPSLAGVCPHGTIVKTNCTAKVKIGNGLPTAKSVTSEIVQANKVNDPTYSTKLQASLAKKPESGAKPADEEVEAEALSGHGRKLASIGGSILTTLANPAVTVNAERFQPIVVLPKPILSFGVPASAAGGFPQDPVKFTRPRPPIVVLPRPPLEFIPPNINVKAPDVQIPTRDIVVPILPVPPVTFIPPASLSTNAGGLNIARKYAVIDASRLGPRTSFEVNLPSPLDVGDFYPPVQVEVKPPGQTVIDLSSFGPRDSTVVTLPNWNITLPDPVKVIPEPGHVRVVNLAGAQTGPVYEFNIPNLPERNKININLPKVNFTGVTLPGSRDKDLVIVNLKNPDMPPRHMIKVTVDASKAGIANLPLPYKLKASGPNTTNINAVTLPPINFPDRIGNIVTIDARHNTTGPKLEVKGLPDIQVVSVTLPNPPKFGRDVNLTLPNIDLQHFVPAGIKPGDDGGLNLTTTVIEAKLPSFNVIPALNKPFIKPGNFSISTKGDGAGKGAWGLSVSVEDVMFGKPTPVAPIKIGGPIKSDSALGIIRDAVVSYIDNESGQFCHNTCCPACKPRPVKTEFAPLVVKAAEPQAPVPAEKPEA
ncbi:hypothetical protein MNEG_3119 [Monoraphidium neglectum]|uniref:Uncharacterized protein n=1 Tax=Monoraphidium neglectum TaxID=145388 RepID=A0A0D2MWK1_9CHLO|nr:hypothetical protein MNEG_3119 [Monoraphidium neglectum]KIZ04837.1 hypothetical protein MNEG_3119 [Monoraphidium neglectum]|eukprot:XP_013903856.1 hypothetical protein MNEG_3119 [Monoraphidium neglectum]